ncbi:MAG: hypothetical protein AAGB15_06825, partial [Pseudomonadota bacterium]
MTALITLLTVAISTAGLVHLTFTNPKRLRSLKRPPIERRYARLARAAVWTPGLLLAVMGETAALVMWLAALTTIGWALAAAPVTTGAAMQSIAAAQLRRAGDAAFGVVWSLGRALSALTARLPRLPLPSLPQRAAVATPDTTRIETLEQRVAE